MLKILSVILLNFCFVKTVYADNFVISANQSYDLQNKTFVYIDETGNKTIEDIVKLSDENFNVRVSDKDNFGYSDKTFWLKFTLENHNKIEDWLLEMEFTAYYNMSLYEPVEGGKFRKIQNDLTVKIKDRQIEHRHFFFPVNIGFEESKTFYMEIKSQYILVFPLKLRSYKATVTKIKFEYYLLGVFYGILLIMFCYNLCLFFALKNSKYLYYSIFLISMTAFQLAMNALSFEFFWPDYPRLQYVFSAFAILAFGVSAAQFVRSFLETKIRYQKLDNVFVYLLCMIPTALLSAIFSDDFNRYNINPTFGVILSALAALVIWQFAKTRISIFQNSFLTKCFLVSNILLFLSVYALNVHYLIFVNLIFLAFVTNSIMAGIMAFIDKAPQSRYFVIGWGLFLVSCSFYIFLSLGLLPSNVFTLNGMQIISSFAVMILSFGLADNFRQERLAKEIAQKNAIKNLTKANKLKDNILSNTTHELRTPISAIIGLIAKVLKTEATISTTSKSDLEVAVSSGNRLNYLINDILTASQLKNSSVTLNLTNGDIGKIVDDVIKVLKPSADSKNIKLIADIDHKITNFVFDENRVVQVLNNLIGNAIKFTNHGIIKISAQFYADQILISVQDTGIGIEKTKHKIIFEAFEQIDDDLSRNYGGTGLGLSIAKELVELHKGKIWVESELNHGSKFCFTLKADFEIGTKSDVKKIETNNIKNVSELKLNNSIFEIMVVEDDPIHNYLVTDILRTQFGCQITSIIDSSKVLDDIKKQKPDLLLLDVMMPKVSGFEIAKVLRKEHDKNSLPIIFLTAKNQAEDIKKAYDIGANDYLLKPINREEIILRVSHYINLILAQKRLNALSSFSNNIKNYTDKNKLNGSLFELLYSSIKCDLVIHSDSGKVCKVISANHEIFKDYQLISPDLAKISSKRRIKVLTNSELEQINKNEYIIKNKFAFKQATFFKTDSENSFLLLRSSIKMLFDKYDINLIESLLKQFDDQLSKTKKVSVNPETIKSLDLLSDQKHVITYIEAKSNYCDIYKVNKVSSELYRVSISDIDNYFAEKSLIRIHRSYMVNIDHIIELVKQNRDYKLSINHLNKVVELPVGRNYSKKIIEILALKKLAS